MPRRIVVVDEIPKGPTGKLQRIGLAERLGLGETDAAGCGVRRAAHRARTRARAALGGRSSTSSGVGADDDFFALGGDSILAVPS